MRMKGRIPYVDSNNPDAWGRCDKTGLPVMYSQLRPQMEYVGNVLQWTGLMVNEKDLDEPNPQLIPPRLKPDPVPVRNPRYFPLPAQPSTPTNLIATAALNEDGKPILNLSWDAVANADQYAVYWTSVGGIFSTLKMIPGNPMPQPNPVIPATQTTYIIPNLSPGTTYTIAVASMNNFGYQEGVNDEASIVLSYNISSPSYGPVQNTYGGRTVLNPYHALFVTTLTT